MNNRPGATNNRMAQVAKSELMGRIRQIHLEESLAEMAWNLCLDEVPVEMAIQRIQDKALERMVPLLDTKILGDAEAMQGCLEMVAEESERVAWKALKMGTEMLAEGLTILEEDEIEVPGGYVN